MILMPPRHEGIKISGNSKMRNKIFLSGIQEVDGK
jgi:hypothetical protein